MKNLTTIGENIMRYGLVFILIAFGIFKFTATEAAEIKPLIDNSPFVGWLNNFFHIRTISSMIGITELMIAIGIGLRFVSSKITFFASILGAVMFLTTLTFLFSTPGLIAKTEWLWLPDGFIIKDLVLLGFCTWSAGESYNHMLITQKQD